MATIDDAILEDVGRLLIDCARQFRIQQVAEIAKTGTISSMVEVATAEKAAHKFGQFAENCEKYAACCILPELALTKSEIGS